MSEAQSSGVGGSYVIDGNSGKRVQVECTKPAAPVEATDAAKEKPTRRKTTKE